jgi:hypothetical protein
MLANKNNIRDGIELIYYRLTAIYKKISFNQGNKMFYSPVIGIEVF